MVVTVLSQGCSADLHSPYDLGKSFLCAVVLSHKLGETIKEHVSEGSCRRLNELMYELELGIVPLRIHVSPKP